MTSPRRLKIGQKVPRPTNSSEKRPQGPTGCKQMFRIGDYGNYPINDPKIKTKKSPKWGSMHRFPSPRLALPGDPRVPGSLGVRESS